MMIRLNRIRSLFFISFILLALPACGGVGVAGLIAQPEAVTVETLPTLAEEIIVPETAVAEPEETAVVEVSPVNPIESAPVVPAAQAPINGSLDALLAQQQAFIDLYARVNPSVVVILTDGGQGSGFVFDNNGHIVTNNHVVQGANQIEVLFADGTTTPATLKGRDPESDLAVVQVNTAGRNLAPIPLGNSDDVRVGQFVIALGSPFGLQSTMTTGIISAVDRTFPGANFQIPDIIQTDAAINPGNSGGPLLDIYGNVIGVNTAIESPVRGSSGIGLAVPANIVASIAPQLIANGQAQTPWVGISGGGLTPDAIAQLGLNIDGGIVVASVIENGPAAKAGLRPNNATSGLGGDIILAVDGVAVSSVEDLLGYLVQQTQVGQTLNLTILRDGTMQTIPLTLEARPNG
jgi:2-alkenal reductase